jgi:hypothetical protein
MQTKLSAILCALLLGFGFGVVPQCAKSPPTHGIIRVKQTQEARDTRSWAELAPSESESALSQAPISPQRGTGS